MAEGTQLLGKRSDQSSLIEERTICTWIWSAGTVSTAVRWLVCSGQLFQDEDFAVLYYRDNVDLG